MTKIRDALMASTKYSQDKLAALAVNCLQRNGSNSDKALVPFINKLRISEEIRALIGIEFIKDKASVYLNVRAADMKSSAKAEGGVQPTLDSQNRIGPAAATTASPNGESGGVHRKSDSHEDVGPADPTKPFYVSDYYRKKPDIHKPGKARRGLAEVQATAKRVPSVFKFEFIASNGDDLASYTSAQGKRFLDATSREGSFVWLCDNWATPPRPESKYRDYISEPKLVEFKALCFEFSKWLSHSSVRVTIDVWLAAREPRHIEGTAHVSA